MSKPRPTFTTRELLENFIRVLNEAKAITTNTLDMNDWFSKVVQPDGSCGTRACVAGYAGGDSWFRERGFRLVRHGGVYNTEASWLVPTYIPVKGEAVQEFGSIELLFEAASDYDPDKSELYEELAELFVCDSPFEDFDAAIKEFTAYRDTYFKEPEA